MASDLQPLLFQAMADPAFYPHAVTSIEQRQTHISTVFLTGDYVYKIKRPVDLGFLDFSTLEQRRMFCDAEVRLNRRLTDGVYLGVSRFSYDGRRFQMDGDGPAVEYAVRMRQLPESRTLMDRLARDAVSDRDLERLTARLADFHASVAAVFDAPVWESAGYACAENFRNTRPRAGTVLDPASLDRVEAGTMGFLHRRKALFAKRISAGRIRDGHGDLRCEHIYFLDDGTIQILDCIEFSDRLRHIDVASDLAFLAMDLAFQGHAPLARRLISLYCRRTGDFELLTFLAFYTSYRAMVRCKVNCIQLENTRPSEADQHRLIDGARRYLALADGCVRQYGPPVVWVFCGLPATGKSLLAARLADMQAVARFNSDEVRKAMHGMTPYQRADATVDGGIYTAEASARVYDRLLELAREQIQRGDPVVLDATYSRRDHRDAVARLAARGHARLLFVECTAPESVLLDRLAQRALTPSVSDARRHHFSVLKQRFQPLDDVPANQHIRIDTRQPPQQCLNAILEAAFLGDAAEGPR